MIVSLSILNVEKEKRLEKIKQFMQVEGNWIHFDVMDGKFVENKTFAYETVEEVGNYCSFFKDVHLMTYEPGESLIKYKEAGADQITFHYESVKESEIMPLIETIKNMNMKVGLSIKPGTDVGEIKQYLPYLDLVLVMSVEPGKGGQKFMIESLEKIRWLNNNREVGEYLISVDGGINEETSKLVKESGADVIVVGSHLTKQEITEEIIRNLI